MKKLLALLLAALFLLSLPLPAARADGASPQPTEKPHNKPRWSRSLAYWEREEFPKITLTGDFQEDLLTIARVQLGYTADKTCYEETASGRKKYYTRYGAWYGSPYSDWCDSFVSFCVYYAGNADYPREYSCERHMFRLKAAGYWREWNAYVPQPGDIAFFALNENSAAPNHVGIVEEVVWDEGDKAGYLIRRRTPSGPRAGPSSTKRPSTSSSTPRRRPCGFWASTAPGTSSTGSRRRPSRGPQRDRTVRDKFSGADRRSAPFFKMQRLFWMIATAG